MSDETAGKSLATQVTDDPHAPLIFFDAAPACGHYGGIVAITLAVDLARTIEPSEITVRHTVIAYLRTNVQGAKALRESLDRAILLATPTAGGKN
ncbi:hypothetical protein [Lichenihabitans psoromatis]|uniref:hypothetical protein n=1 Tax=Lichenihabitans psoromatis TaxID=2528642 RepID=UPI0010368682|nr:hypothetical protein [Lichenihabitans psoromatis]